MENFKIVQEFTPVSIMGLLCCAFEGGSNYWVRDIRVLDKVSEGTKLPGPEDADYFHWSQTTPVLGGSVMVTVDCDGIVYEKILDRKALESGLNYMSKKYTKHFNDFTDETDDATTGDVFLQCCLFGEVIFG